ncbi:MAG: FAD-dependent oxidoreductase [Burkholderiaceae bacterium]
MRSVAVIGSGIAGLSVARGLTGQARVTLYEAGAHFGGHANTVDIHVDGVSHGVDTGFLVLNERTYPNLIALFADLDVALAPSEMSFSVQAVDAGIEWSGSNLDTVFAQRANLLRPRFWRMLAEIIRFNRVCTVLAEGGGELALDEPIGDFLDRERFTRPFRDWYLLPMIGCIWSCPTDQMLRFPIATLIRFCHHHGLLQIANRPRWFTVEGGSRRYVERMLASIPDARLNTPVHQVRRVPAGRADAGVWIHAGRDGGGSTERFDEVVFACHSDQALALLADASADERSVLGAIRFHSNRAVLHTDASVLPRRRRAWAAWNYRRAGDAADERAGVCLHYWLNRLQPLPFTTPVIVSLNPLVAPRDALVHGEFDYAHPVFDRAAIAAQQRLPELQGRAHSWFCGAWTGYGFHEDGLVSGLAVCAGLRSAWAAADAIRKEAA